MEYSLYEQSIAIIKQYQSSSGSYIASPNFPSYAYSWLRDGSFIAHSMDQAGEFESSRNFYRWIHRTLQSHSGKVDHIVSGLESGSALKDGDFLHTRYSLDGKEVFDDATWGNFQYDGYGTWLWALAEHVRLSGERTILSEVSDSVQLTARYLSVVWKLPGYDCWEEHPQYLHPYSLAAVFAGLRSAAELAGMGIVGLDLVSLKNICDHIHEYVVRYGTAGGVIVKSISPGTGDHAPEPCTDLGVDSSLFALSTPYGLFEKHDPLFQATLQQIEDKLHRPGGGVYRYLQDTYFGGGEWILLAAWLGWHLVLSGQPEKGREIATWIESQSDEHGWLPEQVNVHLLAPEYLRFWQEKWGPVASPLLWSHAMYIILCKSLEKEH